MTVLSIAENGVRKVLYKLTIKMHDGIIMMDVNVGSEVRKMTDSQLKKRRSQLGARVMSLSVSRLLLRQHYFASAVGRLSLAQLDGTMLTDGKQLCYDPSFVLERYRIDDCLPVHDLLHSLLHNIFRHWSTGSVQPKLWDVCCDIACEALIAKISPELDLGQDSERRHRLVRELSSQVKPLTAEKLYAYLSSQQLTQQQLNEYSLLFCVDDHRLWHKKNEKGELEPEEALPTFPIGIDDGETDDSKQKVGDGDSSDGEEQKQSDRESNGENGGCEKSGGDSKNSSDNGGADKNDDGESGDDTQQSEAGSDAVRQWLTQQSAAETKELDERWKEIARQIQSELEAFGTSSDEAGLALVETLEHVSRERTDYRSFLRRFAVSGEVMKSDPDSFDVNFYCYGMQLYGNVAFIEPPEYKEVKRVKDFVIAIDTSGSVGKDTVRAFVQKTYNILKSEESFFSRVNIHILQCDTRIQDAAVLGSSEELESYIDKLELKGFGGTDFRPVFEYVDRKRASGELKGLKGIVYFTDGLGAFPEKAPDYEAAFVFLQGIYEKNERPQVPPWAVKIILEENEVLE